MRAGQALLVAVISMDVELRETVHALQLTKAVQWYFAGACDELQQFGTLFFVEGTDRAPEPLDLWGGNLIIVIFGMILPVVDINVR